MVFYIVYDGDEFDQAFATKSEAMAAAHDINRDLGTDAAFHATVRRLEVGRPTREVLVRIYNRNGFVVRSDTIV